MDDLIVLRIDLRNDHGDILCPAVRAVVGDHGGLVLRVIFLDGADLVLGHIHRGEAEIHLCRDSSHLVDIDDLHALILFGHGDIQLPAAADRFLVSLAGASGAGGQDCDIKPGMVLENGQETLSHHSGCAQDRNLQLPIEFHLTLPRISRLLSQMPRLRR